MSPGGAVDRDCRRCLPGRFVKYNDLLRGFGPALKGCKGNHYVTTTHVINSAIVKSSKLTKARKVYRGVSGGKLPESFWRPNKQGVKGGIEAAFMSTTFDRDVAMQASLAPLWGPRCLHVVVVTAMEPDRMLARPTRAQFLRHSMQASLANRHWCSRCRWA